MRGDFSWLVVVWIGVSFHLICWSFSLGHPYRLFFFSFPFILIEDICVISSIHDTLLISVASVPLGRWNPRMRERYGPAQRPRWNNDWRVAIPYCNHKLEWSRPPGSIPLLLSYDLISSGSSPKHVPNLCWKYFICTPYILHRACIAYLYILFLEYLGLLSRVLICLSPMHYKSPNCKYDMSFLSPAHRTVHVRWTLALPKANCRSHNSSTEYSVRRMVFLFASNSCGIAEEAKLRVSGAS